MKVKIKSCKGTGKAKGYGCGQPSYERVYGLGRSCLCYPNWLIFSDEGKKKLARSIISGKKKVDKARRAEVKEQRIKLTEWKYKLQDRVNEIVRLIDIGQPCLARNRHSNKIDAGHIFSRGSNQSIRFNLHNIHRQSAQSNHFQNEDGLLREGLVKEYGMEYMTFISELRQTPALKYTNDEYRHLYRNACTIALELRKDGKTFNKKERIEMRNKLNIKLNIYNLKFCNYGRN